MNARRNLRSAASVGLRLTLLLARVLLVGCGGSSTSNNTAIVTASYPSTATAAGGRGRVRTAAWTGGSP
jgi:hypothetical protein